MSALRRLGVVLALVIALAALGWYGWRAWDGSRAVQSTEDAYVRGDITALSPRVSGYAVEITADDNEAVTARQVLVRLDPRDYQAAVDRAEAQVRQAISQLARAEVQRQNQQLQITSAEAALGSAQAQAQRNGIDLSRARELRATGAGTQARLDDATAADQATRATALEAKANLDLQRQTLQQVDADALVARATLAAARASLASARIALEDTEVWAPIDGIVAASPSASGRTRPSRMPGCCGRACRRWCGWASARPRWRAAASMRRATGGRRACRGSRCVPGSTQRRVPAGRGRDYRGGSAPTCSTMRR